MTKRPLVKLSPVFYDGVSEIKNRAGDVGATIEQEHEPSDQQKWNQNSKTWNFVKTGIFDKFGPNICTPPILGSENLSKQGYTTQLG